MGPPTETERRCATCGQVKPIEEYKNGCAHLYTCKACKRLERRQKYEAKRSAYVWQREERKICEWCENLKYCKQAVRYGHPLHPDCERPDPIELIPERIAA